jgi:hypothetical protein
MALEKNTFLDRLLRTLTRPGCAVSCNGMFDDWDLQLRRGALGIARVRMVAEHHGGQKRLARLSVVVVPPRSLYFIFGTIAALAVVMEKLGSIVPAAVMAIGFVLLWIAVIAEANRLEASIKTAAANAAQELEADRHGVSTLAPDQQPDIEEPHAREKASLTT